MYKRDEPLYQGRQLDINRLAFHSDQGATDLIALLSIGAAKEGGESKWVSSIAIHNELLRRGRKVRCCVCTYHTLYGMTSNKGCIVAL